MKRSEMVEILKDAINEHQYQDYMFDTQTADKVLKVLENYEMLPPTIRNPELDDDIKNEYDHACQKAIADLYNYEGPGPYNVNQWENENDT